MTIVWIWPHLWMHWESRKPPTCLHFVSCVDALFFFLTGWWMYINYLCIPFWNILVLLRSFFPLRHGGRKPAVTTTATSLAFWGPPPLSSSDSSSKTLTCQLLLIILKSKSVTNMSLKISREPLQGRDEDVLIVIVFLWLWIHKNSHAKKKRPGMVAVFQVIWLHSGQK